MSWNTVKFAQNSKYMDKEILKKTFIEKANKKHNCRYDYSKVEYVDSKTKVCIICPEHGEFWQTPNTHVSGSICPKCANQHRGDTFRSNRDTFIKKAAELHNCRYGYSKVVYKSSMDKVIIICPEHGEFEMTPMCHLLGQGCPKCSRRGLSLSELINEFKKVHGDKYNYDKVILGKLNDKAVMTCPKHGDFLQSPTKHLRGQGCPKCGVERRSEGHRMTTEGFIMKARAIHGDVYSYNKVEYIATHTPVTITCKIHGDFQQTPNDHLCGHGCPSCGNNMSTAESAISDCIKSFGFETKEKDRTTLEGYEIDVLVPSENIGIEYDGLKWHSDEYKEDSYHLWKTDECLKKGIRLIHVFEDEWVNKQDIVKSMLASIFGKVGRRIFARKCALREVGNAVKKMFLEENHIQGDVASMVNYGLYYDDELVSMMCFGKPRLSLGSKESKDGEYELLRFCNKKYTTVVGGASKMFKHFISEYDPELITSYCDKRWSLGNMYTKLGLTLSHISKPNYYYVQGQNRKNRFKYRKSELVKEGFDADKTEREIMKERGIHRIYDCGAYVFKWVKP